MSSDIPGSSLVEAWGLVAHSVTYPTSGTMNDIAIVATAAGKVVLRGHRRTDHRRVDFEHEVMSYARLHGVPVPDAIPTLDGELVVERDGRLYSLFEHAKGVQVERTSVDAPIASAMGLALATLHRALRAFPTARAPRARRGYDFEQTLRRVEQLVARLESLDRPSESDGWAMGRLRSRAEWLRNRPNPTPVDLDDEQLVHGD